MRRARARRANGDGWDDLAGGIPSEDFARWGGSSVHNTGAIAVFPGSGGGIVAAADTSICDTPTDPATYNPYRDANVGFALVG